MQHLVPGNVQEAQVQMRYLFCFSGVFPVLAKSWNPGLQVVCINDFYLPGKIFIHGELIEETMSLNQLRSIIIMK